VGLVLVLAAASSPAFARVGAQDLEQAAAEVERARAAAGAAGTALAEARAEEQRLRARLEDLVGEVAAGEWRLGEAQEDARRRARSLYMEAGTVPGAGERSVVRAAYAAAVGRADREAVNALVAAVEDLQRRREVVRGEAAAMRRLTGRLADLEAAAGPVLAAAEAEYRRMRAVWEAQEAERLRLEREAAAAAAATTTTTTTTADADAATTTSTSPAASTTTAPAGVPGGPFGPLVERWRTLVARYFPPELVNEALAIIACESLGDPAIVHPLSGTAGLFQHHPRFWAARAAAAGFPGATPDDPEANTAAAAWLVAESVASGLSPWYFWACQP